MKQKMAILFLVFANLLVADTPVPQGTIDGDTWTSENSPYIVNGNLIIEDLTIQPGVEIRFTDKYKFEVNGILRAEGFHSDSIYFKPDASNPNSWEGIKFKNTSIASSLSYCRIEGAVNQGIFIDQVQPDISNCRIVNNIGNGIRLKDTGLEIKHCIITHNTINGIYLDVSQISASNSIISANTLNGILSTNAADVITLINTVIADNQNIGLSCQKGMLSVKNSIIYDNATQIFIVDNVPDVTYSAIQGTPVYSGTGNINNIPNFENHSLYTLAPQSPCVDRGNPALAYNDKYFPPSLGGSRNDMGAYGGPEANLWYPPLYIKPPSISFGKVTQDSSAAVSANILNYRNTGIAVSDIDFSGDDNQVFSADRQNFFLPVSDSLELGLSFLPDQEMIFQANMVLQTLSHGKVFLPLSGEGIVAKMNVMLPSIDFGTVNLGKSDAIVLPIQNTGSDTLRLNVFLVTGSPFSVNISSLLIGPASSSNSIEVNFTPVLPVSYQDSLIILSNDPLKSRVAIPIKGMGTGPVIEFNEDPIEFGAVSVYSDRIIDLILGNSGNSPLIIDDLNITDQHPDSIVFEITSDLPGLPITIMPGSSVNVPIRFAPISAVSSTARLMIRSNDPFNGADSINLSGTGIAGSLVLSATELNFNQVPLDSQSIFDLTIHNEGLDDLVIDSLEITGQHVDSLVYEIINSLPELPITIAPDSNLMVQVGFSPMKAGRVNAQLVFKYYDPSGKEAKVRLTGTGIAGRLMLSHGDLNFNEVSLNSQSILDLTIGNEGQDDLIIDSLGVTGQHPDSLVFEITGTLPDRPIIIAPDSSLIVRVGFSPIKPGMVNAQLAIKYSDPFSKDTTIMLSGTGIAGYLTLSSTELDFNEVSLNAQSVLDLTIGNGGSDDLIIDSLGVTGQHPDSLVFQITGILPDRPIIIAPDSSLLVRVGFTPIKAGTAHAQLAIRYDDPFRKDTTVMLTGTGIAGSLILSAVLN